jgi:hypothetical protein
MLLRQHGLGQHHGPHNNEERARACPSRMLVLLRVVEEVSGVWLDLSQNRIRVRSEARL